MLGFTHPQFTWDAHDHIFEHLTIADKLNLAQLNREAKLWVDDPFFWKQAYRHNGLPDTDQRITRTFFLKTYKKQAIPLLSEVTFLLKHKQDIYNHFPRNSYKWDALFSTIEKSFEDIPKFNANLKDTEQAVETINKRLTKLQYPILPGVNLTWHYLSRIRPEWLDDIVDKYPQDDSSPSPVKHINFQHCGFKSLPENIARFEHVETLDLYTLPLTSLPESLKSMSHLEMLLCSDGDFSNFPEVIYQCKHLKTLSLHNMNVYELNENLSQLSRLEYLYLLDNQLAYLPKAVEELHHLQSMPINNNPLKHDQPKEVMAVLKKLKIPFHPVPDDLQEQVQDVDLTALTEQLNKCYLPNFHTANRQNDDKEAQPKSLNPLKLSR